MIVQLARLARAEIPWSPERPDWLQGPVAQLGFWCPGRVTTMSAPNRNHEPKKIVFVYGTSSASRGRRTPHAPASCSVAARPPFLGDKASVVWSWRHTSIRCPYTRSWRGQANFAILQPLCHLLTFCSDEPIIILSSILGSYSVSVISTRCHIETEAQSYPPPP
jgi:hypothetical protein